MLREPIMQLWLELSHSLTLSSRISMVRTLAAAAALRSLKLETGWPPVRSIPWGRAEGQLVDQRLHIKGKGKNGGASKGKAKGKALKPKKDDDGEHAEDVHGKAKAKAKAIEKNKGKAKAKAKGKGCTKDNPQGLRPWQSPKRNGVYPLMQ